MLKEYGILDKETHAITKACKQYKADVLKLKNKQTDQYEALLDNPLQYEYREASLADKIREFAKEYLKWNVEDIKAYGVGKRYDRIVVEVTIARPVKHKERYDEED